MSRKRVSLVPSHLSKYEANRYREQPLLLFAPEETHQVRLSLEDSISFFIPIDSKNGLYSRGCLLDGRVDSDAMRLLQCFCIWTGWLSPQRWCDMEPIIVVFHRDPDGDSPVQDDTTAAGILIYFQHTPQTFEKKNQDEPSGMQEEVDGALPENTTRSLPEQLMINAKEFFEMCYQTKSQADMFAPKRQKRIDVTDIFPQRITDLGISLRVVRGEVDFEEHLQRAMPKLLRSHTITGNVNPASPFFWHVTESRIKNFG